MQFNISIAYAHKTLLRDLTKTKFIALVVFKVVDKEALHQTNKRTNKRNTVDDQNSPSGSSMLWLIKGGVHTSKKSNDKHEKLTLQPSKIELLEIYGL